MFRQTCKWTSSASCRNVLPHPKTAGPVSRLFSSFNKRRNFVRVRPLLENGDPDSLRNSQA
jgi:hypothetical protein